MKILMTFVFLLSLSSASGGTSPSEEMRIQPRDLELKNNKQEYDLDENNNSEEVKKVLQKSKEERTMIMKA